MEEREGTRISVRVRPRQVFPIFIYVFSICVVSAGCGAPGDPIPPTPPVPAAVTDLIAYQAGDGVQLIFTPPTNSISGEKLATAPAVEILRSTVKPDGSPDAKSFRVVDTIPGALVDNYRAEGRVRFNDPIPPDEIKTHAGGPVRYIVRTRASPKRASADSNVVSLRLFPVPAPINSVEARVTESAIELTWSVPTSTSAGDPVSTLIGYRVYRSEASPPAPMTSRQEGWPLSDRRDNSFSFDHTYVYTVRSVIQADGHELESSDSQPLVVTPRDTFPPAPPQGVVSALLPGASAGTVVVDLSWSINVETDLAGYRVYRSEQEGARGHLLTPDLLPTPAVRDTSVQPGHHYWYIVTAVDRAGNESAPSAPVAVEITQPLS